MHEYILTLHLVGIVTRDDDWMILCDEEGNQLAFACTASLVNEFFSLGTDTDALRCKHTYSQQCIAMYGDSIEGIYLTKINNGIPLASVYVGGELLFIDMSVPQAVLLHERYVYMYNKELPFYTTVRYVARMLLLNYHKAQQNNTQALTLEVQLQQAIADENYEQAAVIRDVITRTKYASIGYIVVGLQGNIANILKILGIGK